jgi:hypothetical protein
MAVIIDPAFQAPSLIANYPDKSGHLVTKADLTFPLKHGEETAKSPVINLEVETDTSSRIVTTLDVGPTVSAPNLHDPPHLTRDILVFVDPGWAAVLTGAGKEDQPLWGGKILIKHLLVRCEAGAVAIFLGYIDPYQETSTDPVAKTRPHILQAGGVFAQSFKSVRPYLIKAMKTSFPTETFAFTQGVPSILLRTFEDFNRIRLVAVAERYN